MLRLVVQFRKREKETTYFCVCSFISPKLGKTYRPVCHIHRNLDRILFFFFLLLRIGKIFCPIDLFAGCCACARFTCAVHILE